MSTKDHKAIVRRVFEELISKGNLALAKELIAPNFTRHGARPGEPQGLEGFLLGLGQLREAFPDWSSSLDDLVAEGDKVAARWTMGGTHQGMFLGVAASGRKVTTREAGVFRIENGKLVDLWSVVDELSLLVQLGAMPPGQ